MHLRHRYAVLVAAALLALPLAGCGDGDPPKAAPFTPTGHVETPTSSPSQSASANTPVEPTLPDAATQATEDGARAFITYYWDLINYAQATGDVKTLKAASAPSCAVCNGMADGFRKLYRSGGHLLGGTNSVAIEKAAELNTKDRSAFGFRLELQVSHDEQVIVDGEGREDQRGAGSNTFTAYLLWLDNARWRTDVLDLH